jgi:hypothetical protein
VTVALGAGSSAIAVATCLQPIDQRGFLRPGTGKVRCDSGAYESGHNVFATWYSDGGVNAGFQSQAVGYVAGAPGAWTNVVVVPADFNGDGQTDLLVHGT